MNIPIHREGSTSVPVQPNTSSKTSSSYTSKKSVRITPKITDIEILNHPPRPVVVQQDFKPVSILSSPKSDWNDLSSSALKTFEANNRRWARDDIEDFVTPSSRSLLKDKFDNFSNQMMTPMFKEHPIKIDTFVAESDRYVLTLNVQQFKADEIEVKVTDNTISVTGKHEEKKDEANFSCQEYSRKHTLPIGVKADDIKCALSVGGILTISAPRKEQNTLQMERAIPIKHSGLSTIRV